MLLSYRLRLPLLLSCALLAACATPRQQEQSRLLALADDIAAHGDYTTATTLYERAADLSGEPVDIQLRLGNARLANGDLQGALRAFRAALEDDLDNAEALLGMGTAQLRLGQIERAQRNLRRAAPAIDTPPAWSRLGAAQALLGHSEAAVTAFARAASRRPNDPDAQANLALAQALAGHHAEAITRLRNITQSPLAEERHFRSLVLVLVLAQQDPQAETLDLPDMPPSRRASLIERAKHIRDLASPAEQARAIGFAMSAT